MTLAVNPPSKQPSRLATQARAEGKPNHDPWARHHLDPDDALQTDYFLTRLTCRTGWMRGQAPNALVAAEDAERMLVSSDLR